MGLISIPAIEAEAVTHIGNKNLDAIEYEGFDSFKPGSDPWELPDDRPACKYRFTQAYFTKFIANPAQIASAVRSMSNEEHIVQDIHNILKSYYKVRRKTFVDSVCRQSVIYYLLECDEGPLALFSPIVVNQLSAAALEEIAGEAPGLKRSRAQLTKEVASLTKAGRILARI
jgi:hypothetical protein